MERLIGFENEPSLEEQRNQEDVSSVIGMNTDGDVSDIQESIEAYIDLQISSDQFYRDGLNDFVRGRRDTPAAKFYVRYWTGREQ